MKKLFSITPKVNFRKYEKLTCMILKLIRMSDYNSLLSTCLWQGLIIISDYNSLMRLIIISDYNSLMPMSGTNK